MKIEISIKASSLVKQDLLAGLADLVRELHIEETADKQNSDRFALNFFFEAESPDGLLRRIAAVISKIENHYPNEQGIDIHVRNIERSEPVLHTVLHGKPFSPVEGIRIIPWDDRKNTTATAHDILLDPGHAFGSGLHPSTHLCLQLIKQVAERDSEKKYASYSVLDIGCGSGILTIAALRLGAARVLGLEIHPDVAQVARRNIEINRLAHSAQVIETSWHDVSEQYDLVLANLVPSVLLKSVSSFAKLLREKGLLITAGFQASNNKKILTLFEQNDLRLINESSLDGWGAMLLEKIRL